MAILLNLVKNQLKKVQVQMTPTLCVVKQNKLDIIEGSLLNANLCMRMRT